MKRGIPIRVFLLCAALGVAAPFALSQATQDAPRQMLATPAGFIALESPKGWEQAHGPGLAFFLPKGVDREHTDVYIYLNYSPVGPHEDDKDAASYMQSDIRGFKAHFAHAEVRAEKPIELPLIKATAPVYTFMSGEKDNPFEQVIYIADLGKVWILTLDATNEAAFKRTIPLFYEFAKTFGGAIQFGSPDERK